MVRKLFGITLIGLALYLFFHDHAIAAVILILLGGFLAGGSFGDVSIHHDDGETDISFGDSSFNFGDGGGDGGGD